MKKRRKDITPQIIFYVLASKESVGLGEIAEIWSDEIIRLGYIVRKWHKPASNAGRNEGHKWFAFVTI